MIITRPGGYEGRKDKGYQFAYSQFDNPTFVKYSENGKVIDSVSFIHNYIALSFCRKA